MTSPEESIITSSSSQPVPSRALVVIPTFNERDNLDDIVGAALSASAELDVVVVDDASPDGTGELADELARQHGRVHVLHRQGKRGLGMAYLAGFSWAMQRNYDVVVEMDADGSHNPREIGGLIAALDSADVAQGSRWIAGGRVVNWPARRMLLSRAGSGYARVVLGIPVSDATGGFRAYSSRVFGALDLTSVRSQGYCFQIDMLRRAHAAGLTIVEVPITFVERTRGASKMSVKIVLEAVVNVTVWGVERLFGNRRIRVESHADIHGADRSSLGPSA